MLQLHNYGIVPVEEAEEKPSTSSPALPLALPGQFDKDETERIQRSLETNLEAHEMATREGGAAGKLTYIEGWRAVDKAQKIFGFNGWSSKIIELKVCVLCWPAPHAARARLPLLTPRLGPSRACAEGV